MHQQPQWAAAIWFAEIKFQGVRFGEALKVLHLEVAEITMRQ